MKKFSLVLAATLVILTWEAASAQIETKYWDIDGATAGAGGSTPNGFWDNSSTNWSTNPNGTGAPTTFDATVPGDYNNNGTVDAADYVLWRKGVGPLSEEVETLGSITPDDYTAWRARYGNTGDVAVFSAGTDATGEYIVIVSSRQKVGGLTVEDGKLILSGSATNNLLLGPNPVTIKQGATLQIPNVNNLSVSAGHVLTLDGGTISNSIVGAGSGLYPSAGTETQLTSNGGTFDTPNGSGGAYSILLYNSPVGLAPGTTTATLRKTGAGEFRGLNNWTFTTLDVQQGLYRINGTGGGETGFGAATGTVTTAGGALPDDYVGSALGTSIGITSPATRSFVLGGSGNTAFVLNAGWTIDGAISGVGGLMLNGWTRKDTNALIGSAGQLLTLRGTNTYQGETRINFGTLVTVNGSAIPDASPVVFTSNNTFGVTVVTTAVLRIDDSETIGSLDGGAGNIGSVNLNATDSVLTTGGNNSSTTFAGSIIGTGSLVKAGTGTFAMNGTKSYTGNTTVQGGTLSTNSDSLADTADVLLNSGSFFNLDFSATDTIRSLFINGTSQAVGLWGAVGNGGATFTTPLITGNGLLNVTTLVGSAAGLAAVPEPATISLLVVGWAAVTFRRRSR